MRTIGLGKTGIETTALGFGCADLFREPTRKGRQALLEAAFAAGIRHFDVAPMYGLGRVEAEVSRFLEGRRDEVVLATKFGIAPTAIARAVSVVQGPLQRQSVARRSAGGDPRAGAVGRLLYETGRYDVAAARSSLERSLRRLRSDHVDLLFLHDPPEGEAVSDELRDYLESARAAGLLRGWGVAGDTAAGRADVPIVQTRWSRFATGPVERTHADIRFGVIGAGLERVLAFVLEAPDRRRRWSDAVGADCGRPEVVAGLLLHDALEADPSAPVLFASTRAEHVRAAAAAEEHPADALSAFRSLLTRELLAPAGAR